MASLWKRPNSRFYWACFTDAQGRQRKRSTKCTNKRLAQRIADSYESLYVTRRTSAHVRRTMAALHQEISGESISELTAASWLRRWLDGRRSEVAASTASAYEAAINEFVGSLADPELPMTLVEREDVYRFRDSLQERLSARTVAMRLKILRMALRQAVAEGQLPADPCLGVRAPKAAAGEGARRAFTMPELQRVLAAAGDGEWRGLVLLGLYTGQRLWDVATVRWQQVDLEQRSIAFVSRKTGRRTLVPVCGALHDHLLALPAADDPAAPLHPLASAVVERTGRTALLSNQFATILEQAGLRPAGAAHKRSHGDGRGARRQGNALSFHSLRHTATSLLKRAGVPAAVVQDIVGHDSAAMSAHYTHIDHETKVRALEQMPRV